MRSDEGRRLLFWRACIPVRLVLGVAAAAATLLTRRRLVFFALGGYGALTAGGMAWSAVLTALGRKTEGGLGGKVWWNRSRFVHIALWSSFAALCFLLVPGAGLLLLADALAGVAAGVAHFGG